MAEETETTSCSSTSDQQPSSASPPESNLKQPQIPAFVGFQGFGYGEIGMLPVMCPVAFSGLNQWENQQQTNNRGAGIYAVPVHPYSGIPSNTLIPLTYSVPTSRPSTEAGAVGSEHGQAGQEQQQAARQRQLVGRRFQIVFHLDLLLILKLAAVIFVFHQDGSRLRLSVLIFVAALIYLYQTGALTPLLRWLSQSMHRAAQPPRPAVGAENVPAVAREGNDVAEGQAGDENDNQPLNDGNQAALNENAVEPGANGGNQWWGIMKEIQMIVFGFITSLLPGFHNID